MSGGVYIAPKVDIANSTLITYIQGIMQVGDIATVADTTTGLLYYIPKSGSPYQAVSGVTSVAGLGGTVSAASLAAALDTYFLTPAEGNAAYDAIGAASTVQSNLTSHINNASGAHAASAISNVAAGGISATNVQAALNELDSEKANLASPAFTGNPTAPTPSLGDNDTSIATTAFVNAEIANDAPNVTLANVGSAPNAQGASLSSQQLTLQPASGSFPGLLSSANFNNLARFFGTALFNVKDFGAVADDVLGAGGTDNSTAIQNAINAAQSAGGGIVFFPPGLYSIQTGLTVTGNSVHLMGCGSSYTADVGDYRATGGSWLSWRGPASTIMLTVAPNAGASQNPIFGFRITGLNFDGRDLQVGSTDTGATPPAIGILMQAVAGAHLQDFFMNGPFTTAAISLGALTAGTIGGVDTHGVVRSIFERFCIRQLDGAAPGIGIQFSGTATANVNFCKFDTFQIMYLGSSSRKPAIQLGNSDSNTFVMGACNRAGSGTTNWGIEILGSNTSASEVSRANFFMHCSAGANGVFLAGTASGRDPAGTSIAALNFTNPSTDNQLRPYSTENGEPVPVFGTGSTGGYGITGGSTGPRFYSEGASLASRSAQLVINTTALTSIVSFVAPPNFMKAGTVIELRCMGYVSNAAVASTHNAQVRFNAANPIGTLVALGATARTTQPASITCRFVHNGTTVVGSLQYTVMGGAVVSATSVTSGGAVATSAACTIDLVLTSSIATSTFTVNTAEIVLVNQ